MKTLLKVVAVLVGLVVVAVVAAIIIVPMVFDPNDYKEELAAAVKESTGRELRLPGEIGLTVFPWLGATLGVVELSNAPGFPGDFFARTEKVDVRIKLLPLLGRKVEMSTVTIYGLELNLMRDKAGRSNWDDLTEDGKRERPEKSEPGERGPGLAALAIGGLDIQNAALRWTDDQTGQKLAISDLSLRTGPVALGRPVELDLGFKVAAGKPRITGVISMRATLDADLARKIYKADGLTFTADLTGESLPGGKASLRLAANVSADLAGQTARIEGLTIGLLDLEASGNLTVKRLLEEAKVIDGTIEIAQFNPRALLEALGQPAIETADAKALSAFSASLTVSGTPGRVTVKPLKVKLDDTNLDGTLEVGNLAAAMPSVRFDLAVDGIDADRYLPPAGEKPAATPARATAAAGRLPLEMLRALDIDGKLRVAKLKITNLNVSDINMALKAKNGVITLSPITAKLYGGAYSGTTRLDVRGSKPKLAAEERLSKVQAGPLLEDLLGQGRLSGEANADLQVTAVGATAADVKQTLNGRAKFAFTNGAVKGINIPRMIREAQAKLKGQSLPPSRGELKTDFSELTGSIRFENGLATNNDLLAKSPFLRIEGKGTADLKTEQIDYRVKTTLVASTKGQGGADLSDLAGIPIPIKVTGSFTAPQYGLDFEAFASAVAKSKATALVGKQKEAVTKQVEKAVGDKLGGAKAGGLLKGLLK